MLTGVFLEAIREGFFAFLSSSRSCQFLLPHLSRLDETVIQDLQAIRRLKNVLELGFPQGVALLESRLLRFRHAWRNAEHSQKEMRAEDNVRAIHWAGVICCRDVDSEKNQVAGSVKDFATRIMLAGKHVGF